MEKVKITQKQADEIKVYKELNTGVFDFLNDLPLYHLTKHTGDIEEEQEEMKKLMVAFLSDDYEVEPEFKVGDWVYNKRVNRVARIDNRFTGEEELWVEDEEFNFYHIEDSRHATPEEIAQEKQRRWWSSHDRKPKQIKPGDILIKKIDSFPVVNLEHGTLDENRYTVACFADKRLDNA